MTSDSRAARDGRPGPPYVTQVADLAERQGGVLGRGQLRSLGVPRAYVRGELRAGRWRRVHRRTYVIHTGPLGFRARVWASVLYAGPDAVASHETAAHLAGLTDEEPRLLTVTVPHGHRVPRRPGLRVRQSRRLLITRHPSRRPPQTRLEDTVLDLVDAARTEGVVVDVVLRACQRRLTTAARLALRSRSRKRMRWRALLNEILSDVRSGVMSALERRYLRDVERAHGLPRGRRNQAEGGRGRRRYRDVRYLRWRIVVELDGRAAHPEEWRELDDVRDNDLRVAEDVVTLRYGWRSVVEDPCGTAVQVASALRRRGWRGSVRPCGPACRAADVQ